MMRGVSATPLVVLAVAVGVAVCTPIPNDPNTPFSIQVDTVPAPSVVAGDTMRDTTGTVQPIRVEVRNIQGHLITTAPVRFISFDTAQLRFDTVGHAMGTPRGDSTPQFIVDVRGLQTIPQTLPVVRRPDRLLFADSDSIQTMTLVPGGSPDTVSLPLIGALRHNPDSAGADSVTRSYLVRYTVIHPAAAASATGTAADTTLPIYLIDASGRPARVDTTDQSGLASRRLLFDFRKIAPPVTDSVVVQLSARYRGQPVAGSPRQFIVRYHE